MALDALNTKINEYRDAAAAIRADVAARIDQIRSNTTLSTEGKTTQIARIHRENAQRVSDLEKKERAALAEQRLTLERTLFGQFASDPTSLLSYRDAQERVARLQPDDHAAARQLLHTAQISGDATLSAALLGKALQNGWQDITDTYSSLHPEKAVQLRDLSDVIHFQEDHAIDFQRSADYSFSKPSEIAKFTDANIERMSDAPDEVHEAPTQLGIGEMNQWAIANG